MQNVDNRYAQLLTIMGHRQFQAGQTPLLALHRFLKLTAHLALSQGPSRHGRFLE